MMRGSLIQYKQRFYDVGPKLALSSTSSRLYLCATCNAMQTSKVQHHPQQQQLARVVHEPGVVRAIVIGRVMAATGVPFCDSPDGVLVTIDARRLVGKRVRCIECRRGKYLAVSLNRSSRGNQVGICGVS